ncbi:NADH-ubiquinone oxidoreductase B18 subunit-domain-containing protein [Leucosporidium creatinivorum]|uniref:NADH dehydrogenase [ubiquinone] 1 beta subcomplex subunit 7 n=1 Tax=Leucosporidium creatinivorum TaxID=106004 RepID=A0A1Y2E5W6_9BASI|nr:NADH-ubiquinone oxidoreductase B18 subunit-domain-containing protein [Leucosporidium creatinivorum]
MGGHSSEPFTPIPAPAATAKQARVPLGWRDACGSLLIPLNVCRHETLFATWKCDQERHIYEKCQYDDYISRMKALEKADRKAREEAE